MSACEKCWADAFMRARMNPMKAQVEHYHDLLYERRATPCSPEEQRGKSGHMGNQRMDRPAVRLPSSCEFGGAI